MARKIDFLLLQRNSIFNFVYKGEMYRLETMCGIKNKAVNILTNKKVKVSGYVKPIGKRKISKIISGLPKGKKVNFDSSEAQYFRLGKKLFLKEWHLGENNRVVSICINVFTGESENLRKTCLEELTRSEFESAIKAVRDAV